MGSITANFYASELRRARRAANLSQEQLAEAVLYSTSTVNMIESSRRSPSLDFTRRADEVLGTDGLLGRILENLVTRDVTPEWFRPWVLVEQEATNLWWYELTVVPGLLQTEAYARAQLAGNEELVKTRLDRQEILHREKPPPPTMVTLLDERVLRHPVGDPTVMAEQLEHLAAGACRERAVQVVPDAARTHHHLDGPFILAIMNDRELAYVSTAVRGFVLSDAETVSRLKRRWDIIRGEALPIGQSVDLMRKVAQEWRT